MSAPNSRTERGLRAGLAHWLAWLNGDTAYVAYLAHLRAHHPERPLPSKAEFHREETERRWGGVRRCC